MDEGRPERPFTEKKKRFTVPEIYRKAAKILKQAEEGKQSVKSLVYSSGFRDIKPLFALVAETIKHRPVIATLLDKSGILSSNPSLDQHVLKVLINELLWGKKYLKPAEARAIKIVLGFQKKFEEILAGVNIDPNTDVNVKVPRYVRVNTLRSSVPEIVSCLTAEGWIHKKLEFRNYGDFLNAARQLEPFEFLSDYHLEFLLVFHPDAQFYNHPLLLKGKIVLQDKASCLPPVVLSKKFSGKVIDACAAPGMKTSLLAALTKNKMPLIAVDRDGKRSTTLRQTLSNCGADSVTVLNKDFLSLNPDDHSDVKYILMDPSCSGSGILKRLDPVNREETEESKQTRLRKLASLQCMLLERALSFPGVKRVVYSTCSVHEEENEQVVEKVLEKFSGTFKLKTAMKSWERRGLEDKFPGIGSKCIRADPVKDLTNGFFVALFEKVQ